MKRIGILCLMVLLGTSWYGGGGEAITVHDPLNGAKLAQQLSEYAKQLAELREQGRDLEEQLSLLRLHSELLQNPQIEEFASLVYNLDFVMGEEPGLGYSRPDVLRVWEETYRTPDVLINPVPRNLRAWRTRRVAQQHYTATGVIRQAERLGRNNVPAVQGFHRRGASLLGQESQLAATQDLGLMVMHAGQVAARETSVAASLANLLSLLQGELSAGQVESEVLERDVQDFDVSAGEVPDRLYRVGL